MNDLELFGRYIACYFGVQHMLPLSARPSDTPLAKTVKTPDSERFAKALEEGRDG